MIRLVSQTSMLLLAVSVLCTGCGLPQKWQDRANKLPEATPSDPVYSILGIWDDAEGVGPDGLPTRGFAGQISFFTRRQETPVRVRGDVRVYVYDDQGTAEERGKPIHQWDFHGDAWAVHLHDGTLGPTYSVFIPYTRKGDHHAQCAVRVRLTPENGQPIYSDTVAVLLPGKLRKKEKTEEVEKPGDNRTELRSITIPLKEKQRTKWEDLELGKSEMHRITAPVSQLGRNAATQEPQQPTKYQSIPSEIPGLLPSALPAQIPQSAAETFGGESLQSSIRQ